MNKRKVLICYHYFPHYRLPVMKELAKDNNYNFLYISGDKTDIEIKIINESEAKINNISYFSIRNHWLFGKKFLWQKDIIRICAKSNFDAVIFLANPHIITTWLSLFIVRVRRKKIFLWGHFTLRNSWKDKFKIIFYHLADGLLLYGNYAKKKLIDKGFNPKRLFVIYNSLDYEKQVRLRTCLNKSELQNIKSKLFNYQNLPILLFIGRLTYEKKIPDLVKVCKKLHEEYHPVNLLIIGDGEEKENLMKLVSKNDLIDFVAFIGECYDEAKLCKLISLSDLCISPGNIGLTSMHSLVYGIPVITHDNPIFQNPEFESVINGKTGAFYRYGSFDSLYNTVKSWLILHNSGKNDVKQACMEVIQKKYIPANQAKEIHAALDSIFKNE